LQSEQSIQNNQPLENPENKDLNDEDDLADLLATIRQPIEGTKFYNPIKR